MLEGVFTMWPPRIRVEEIDELSSLHFSGVSLFAVLLSFFVLG
jgi:hypothetical protein